MSRRKGELPPPRTSSCRRDGQPVATGDAEQLSSAGRAPKHPVSITGLSCLLENAQAMGFSFIATFALDVQTVEFNRIKRPTLYQVPRIKASPWR